MDFSRFKFLRNEIRRLLSYLPMLGSAVGSAVGRDALSNFSINLNWANVDPSKFLYAGTREISRGMSESHLVWQSIPEPLRAAGPEAVAKHLAGFDCAFVAETEHGAGSGPGEGAGARAAHRGEVVGVGTGTLNAAGAGVFSASYRRLL